MSTSTDSPQETARTRRTSAVTVAIWIFVIVEAIAIGSFLLAL